MDRLFGGKLMPLVAHLAERDALTAQRHCRDRGAAEGAEVMIAPVGARGADRLHHPDDRGACCCAARSAAPSGRTSPMRSGRCPALRLLLPPVAAILARDGSRAGARASETDHPLCHRAAKRTKAVAAAPACASIAIRSLGLALVVLWVAWCGRGGFYRLARDVPMPASAVACWSPRRRGRPRSRRHPA